MRRFRNHSRAHDRVRRCAIPTAIIGAAIIGIASFGGAFGAHASDPARATLDLNEAADLAVQQQPLLTSLDAQARAAREASVASAQLPDPQLFGGVRDLPVDTREAYSLSNDSDTQLVVGVSQEFPRAEKRRLRAEQREREADRLTDERRLAVLVDTSRREARVARLLARRRRATDRGRHARCGSVSKRKRWRSACGRVLQRSPTTLLRY